MAKKAAAAAKKAAAAKPTGESAPRSRFWFGGIPKARFHGRVAYWTEREDRPEWLTEAEAAGLTTGQLRELLHVFRGLKNLRACSGGAAGALRLYGGGAR